MAKKRALVDAVLTATAASDIFTQDLEDITANIAAVSPAAPVAAAPVAAVPVEVQSITVSELRDKPLPEYVPADVEQDDEPVATPLAVDFRETRIHFGKNRGLMLSELTPQQVHWYESDWMPKKEVNGPTSVEDLALMQALKAYRAWRSGTPQNKMATSSR